MNVNMKHIALLPAGIHFRNYCLDDNNEKRVQAYLDCLLDPHQPLSVTIQKHLLKIKSYLSGDEPFEIFLNQGEIALLNIFVMQFF